MTEKQSKKLRRIRADLYTLAAELSAEECTEALSQQVREAADAVPLAMPKEIARDPAMEPLTFRAVCTRCTKVVEGATQAVPCDNVIAGERCQGTLLLDR